LVRLTEHIRRFGLRRPIVLYEGAILDGRARLEACRRAGAAPRFTEWDGEGSPLEWLVSENVGRRHLGPSQRAMIALGLMPLLEDEARQGLRARRGRPKKSAHQCALFSKNGRPRARRLTEAAANLAGVSPRYVQMARRLARVFPDVLPSIAAGKVNLRDAQRAARLDDYRRKRFLWALQDKLASGEDLDIRRMLRLTHEPPVPIVGGRPAGASPSRPGRKAPDDALAYTIQLTHKQVRLLRGGAAIRVYLDTREFVLVSRENYFRSEGGLLG
jgi:hypothetical protein